MNRRRFLYVHGITAEEWAKKHDIEPYTLPCSACGRPCTNSMETSVDE